MASKDYGSVNFSNEAELEVDAESASIASDLKPMTDWKKRTLQGLVAVVLVIIMSLVSSPRFRFKTGEVEVRQVERYFHDAIVNHNDPHNNNNNSGRRWSHRYYEGVEYFGGPGHPIFAIIAGEDPIDDLLYPFIYEYLAKKYGAYTMDIEHRFYGTSIPVENPTVEDFRRLLSPDQALEDAVRLLEHKRKEFGCGPRGSDTYCPILAVGGSYPGFLASLLRIHYPHVVDIGYASSAPLQLYAHTVDPYAYFDHVTQVAEHAVPGCADATRNALLEVNNYMLDGKESMESMAKTLGICALSIPDYIDNHQLFAREVMMVLAIHHAENNMGFYPPSGQKDLVKGCKIFENDNYSCQEKVKHFLRLRPGHKKCFDMTSEMPPGRRATISSADWSGVGNEASSLPWDFQSCQLIPETGMSQSSMFPPRPFSMDWLTKHCQSRFNITPDEDALVKKFRFYDNELINSTTHLLFTNGLNDGWSVASITKDLSPSIKAVNFFNGAHHSDLSSHMPGPRDTADVQSGHAEIEGIIAEWMKEIRDGNY